jgi:acetyl esterase
VIPLAEIAPDAVGLIAAFREAGSFSLGTSSIEDSRDGYERSCATNGIQNSPVATIDHRVDVGDETIRIRQYLPSAAGSAAPAVVLVHGGGWVLGNLETHDLLARHLATLTATTVFSVEYRLAPEHKFPVPLTDCVSALKFIRNKAGELGVDPLRITLVGDSAGGALVAALANNPGLAVRGTRIVGQVLLHPVTDLGAETESYAAIDTGFPLTGDSMRWFRDLYLARASDALDPRASPLRLRSPVSTPPRALIITMGLDPLSDEGVEYAGYLAKHGGRVEHHHLPRHIHGIFTSAGRVETGKKYLDRVATFIMESE